MAMLTAALPRIGRDEDPLSLPTAAYGLRFDILREADVLLFLDLVSTEIGRRYPETGVEFARDLLRATSDRYLSAFGGTTTRKHIIASYDGARCVGISVVTEKSDGFIKIGPTVIRKSARGRRLGVLFRELIERLYSRSFIGAFSTCRQDNYAARTYVVRSGYAHVATLPDHYQMGVSELVYLKRFQAANPRVLPGAVMDLPQKVPFELRLKRGGAAKLLLNRTHDPLEAVDAAVIAANGRCIRRVYVETERGDASVISALTRIGFRRESLSPHARDIFGLRLG
jgi:hypothetical protein